MVMTWRDQTAHVAKLGPDDPIGLTVLLVRHGEVKIDSDSRGELIYGDDQDLSQHGQDQMDKLGKFLRWQGIRADEIYCGPFIRNIESAEILNHYLAVPSSEPRRVNIVESLHGVRYGQWVNMPRSELDQLRQVLGSIPGFESPQEIDHRATDAMFHIITNESDKLDELRRRAKEKAERTGVPAEPVNRTIVIIGHKEIIGNGMIRLLEPGNMDIGREMPIRNGAALRIKLDETNKRALEIIHYPAYGYLHNGIEAYPHTPQARR